MEIQHSSWILKPVQREEPLDLADREKKQEITKLEAKKKKTASSEERWKENPLLQTEFYGDSAFLTNIETSAMWGALEFSRQEKKEITNLQAKKKQQAPRKDEKKINYYKTDPMEIQHSLRVLKPVQCEERLI